MAKTKKRNPQDATLRNARAAKKRALELEQRLLTINAGIDARYSGLAEMVQKMREMFDDLVSRVKRLEAAKESTEQV